MSIYLDTSLVVAGLTTEAKTDRVLAWLAAQPAGSLCASSWVATEVSSALATKVRFGTLDLGQRAESLAGWTRLAEMSLTNLPVLEAHFAQATVMIDRLDLGLRAGDALHLAIAASHGVAIATLDHRLAAAAPAVGVPLADL